MRVYMLSGSSMLKPVSPQAKPAQAEVAFRCTHRPAQWRYIVIRVEFPSLSRVDYARYSANESDDLPVLF